MNDEAKARLQAAYDAVEALEHFWPQGLAKKGFGKAASGLSMLRDQLKAADFHAAQPVLAAPERPASVEALLAERAARKEDAEDFLRRGCVGKQRYRNAEHAGKVAAGAHAKGSTDELRTYPCPVCEGWHLTSRGTEDLVRAVGNITA